MSKTSNSLRILLLLSRNGKMSADQLASILELSDRSIRKHMDDLLMAGFPISTVRGRNGGYFLETNPLWNSFLEPEDLDRLAELVQSQLVISPNDPLIQQLELKLKKLSKQDDTMIMSSHSLNADFHHIHHVKKQLKNCLDNILKAVIHYHSTSSGSTSRTVHMYYFIQHNAHDYCVAYCERKKRFLTFKLNRIEKIFVSDQAFSKDESFLLEHFIGANSLFNDRYDIEMLVKKDIYVWFRDTNWTANQTITEYNDDYYLFTGTMYELPEIKQFVLRFGANVIVLNPKSLQEEIRKEVQKIQEINRILQF